MPAVLLTFSLILSTGYSMSELQREWLHEQKVHDHITCPCLMLLKLSKLTTSTGEAPERSLTSSPSVNGGADVGRVSEPVVGNGGVVSVASAWVMSFAL